MHYFRSSLFTQYGLKHGFFTRKGGISTGNFSSLNCGLRSKDDPQNIKQNLAIIANYMGTEVDNLQLTTQVHSADVAIAECRRSFYDLSQQQADAIITNNMQIYLGVQTADCTPILLYDYSNQVKAAIHASWKTVSQGIIKNCLQQMQMQGAQIKTIAVAIGPAIQPQNYEVGEDVREAFMKLDPNNHLHFIPAGEKSSKWLFDLPGYCETYLRSCGINLIDNLRLDTYANEEDFFSFRRETHKAQRAGLAQQQSIGCQLSVI
jgi:YfiH family protein